MELPAELEAAIRQAPDDRDGYLVAADWLSGRGDPQGELIALSLAPPSEDVGSRIAQLQHQLEPVDTGGQWNPVSVEWRWGFVVGVAMSSQAGRDEPETLRAILRSPVARFLRKLVLVNLASGALVDALAADSRALASLRTLIVETEDAVSIEISPIWQLAADLERLVLHVGSPLGPIVLPKLRELSLFGPQAGLFDRSQLPALETCRLRVPAGHEPLVRNQLRWPDVALRLPALRRLTIAGPNLGKVHDWRSSSLVRRLELYDLMSLPQGFEAERQFVVDQIGARVGQRAGLLVMSGLEDLRPGTLLVLPERDELTLGRVSDADFQLAAPSVGRRHTRLLRTRQPGWTAYDMGSTNGTQVNGHRVHECALRSGDELAVGRVEFRFVAGDIEAQANELRARFALGL